jgi:outer membrane biosynthesis protein TonB
VLDFIERHKIGILSTIILHLVLVAMFMVINFGTFKKSPEKQQVLIDFVDQDALQKEIDQKKEEIKKMSQQELKSMQKEYIAKNVAVNEAENQGKQSVEKMVNDIKSELNIKDNKAGGAQPAEKQKTEVIEKKETPAKEQKPDYNAKGERTYYKGATTISYSLEGRTDVYLPVPVYKCQGSGKVVMDIVVNPNGYVLSVAINKAESQITEECLLEAANRAALTSRFNAKGTAPDKQRGRITYIFIAQ